MTSQKTKKKFKATGIKLVKLEPYLGYGSARPFSHPQTTGVQLQLRAAAAVEHQLRTSPHGGQHAHGPLGAVRDGRRPPGAVRSGFR